MRFSSAIKVEKQQTSSKMMVSDILIVLDIILELIENLD